LHFFGDDVDFRVNITDCVVMILQQKEEMGRRDVFRT
jgi:hypothetical protein